MTGIAQTVWLPLFALFYVMVMLYWARRATLESVGDSGFFSAGHSLPPWISAIVIAGASLTGWFVLGGTQAISESGFSLPTLLVAGILLALPGVLFFKRFWFVAERLRVSSQADVFRVYFGSSFLISISVAVAILFAVGFSSLQVRVLSQLAETMTGGVISQLAASVLFGFVIFAGAGIGGMRSIGYFGFVQTVLVFSAIAALAVFALVFTGGFEALNVRLHEVAMAPGASTRFNVEKVIEFTSGLGRGGELGSSHTSLANLSLAFAIMGFQASPLVFKLVLSTRSPKGIAAGQTWVIAGFLGGLIVFAIALTGAAGMVDRNLAIGPLFERLHESSPWFAAWIFIGIAAGVQLLAGLSIFTAAEGLVRHIYKPYFRSNLTKHGTVTLTRIAIAVLAALAMVMENIAPVTLSALGSLALPIAFQLWTPMLGVAWLGWITRQAAVTGVGFGVAGVILTEPLGYHVLSFFGLELPWGRWPWTIHSALWGMAANLAAVLIISAITDRGVKTPEASEIRKIFSDSLAAGPQVRALRSTAWSIAIAWFFLAVGPGLIFGNHAFVEQGAEKTVWLLGMPSLWAWSLAAWVSGLGVVWFLAYKMEMASTGSFEIPPYEPPLRLKRDQSAAERERLRILVITGAIIFVLAVLTSFSFGR